MRPAHPIATAALAAALLAGCGSSSSTPSQTQAPERSPAQSSIAPLGASARSCATNADHADQLRVSGLACGTGRSVMAGWVRRGECFSPAGASRYSCTVHGSYRCLAVRTDRGIAVSCAQPGRSISFVARRG